ncbi:hypothetical protein U9M48_022590, partial [Paspalum notatum var. saurae]
VSQRQHGGDPHLPQTLAPAAPWSAAATTGRGGDGGQRCQRTTAGPCLSPPSPSSPFSLLPPPSLLRRRRWVGPASHLPPAPDRQGSRSARDAHWCRDVSFFVFSFLWFVSRGLFLVVVICYFLNAKTRFVSRSINDSKIITIIFARPTLSERHKSLIIPSSLLAEPLKLFKIIFVSK